MNNKRTALTIIIILLLAAAVLGSIALAENELGDDARTVCGIYGEKALGELNTALAGTLHAMEKCAYATESAYLSSLCAEAAASASSAVTAFGALPCANYELEGTARYINTAGDYMLYLSKKSATGELLSEAEAGDVAELREGVRLIAERTNLLMLLLRDGAIGLDAYGAGEDGGGEDTLGSELRVLESELPDMPELSYDGMYSVSHTDEPQLIKDSGEVTEDDARKNAAKFLGIEPSRLESIGESGGAVPGWHFSYVRGEGDERTVAVTKKGGVVASFTSTRAPGEGNTTAEQAAAVARDFLQRRGYTGMEELSREERDGLIVSTFCYTEDNVYCLPDTLTVAVARDTGEVQSFEAGAYIMSHHDRGKLAPETDMESAKSALPASLTARSERLVVTETDGGNEVLWWEFECADGENGEILVYVDAFTGKQTKIEIVST